MSLKRAFLLATLLGAWPFVISAGSLRVSATLVSYGLLIKAIYSALYLYRCYDALLYLDLLSRTSVQTVVAIFSLSFLLTVVSYSAQFLSIGRYNSILETFSKFDKRMKHYRDGGFNSFYDALILASLSVLALLGRLSGSGYFGNPLTVLHVSFLLANALFSVYPFLWFAAAIRNRFRCLSRFCSIFVDMKCARQKRTALLNLSEMHNLLCSASDTLNRSYHVQLVIFFAVVFSLAVCDSYYVTKAIMRKESTVYVACLIYVILFHVVAGCLIVDFCSSISLEASRLTDLILQKMMDDRTKTIATDKVLSLYVSFRREVVFSARGFFIIDYSLLHSMAASLTTYFVILIELG